MKPFLAAIAGFLTASAIFISGAGFAIYLLMAEPVVKMDASENLAYFGPDAGTANAETREVRTVQMRAGTDPENKDQGDLAELQTASNRPLDGIDEFSTSSTTASDDFASVEPSNTPEALPAVHIAWCSERYRSYRPGTNTYTSYGGRDMPCMTPYIAAEASDSDVSGRQLYAAHDGVSLSSEHVQDCLRRYRSYRPEDNTYQPYGGGPRRQCH